MRFRIAIVLPFLLILTTLTSFSQQTVGLFQHSSGLEEGYILFSPMTSSLTYLIDRCGREVHHWSSNYYPGLAAYLLPDGSIMRAGRLGNPIFGGGGSGGIIEKITWEDSLVWRFQYSNNDHHQHHDIYPMPNGNVLILAWEYHTGAEAMALGRDANITGPDFWSEQVVEVRPIYPDSGEIVWEWHLWDHVVQDRTIGSPNFGSISAHPERFDINYRPAVAGSPPGAADWIHANAVAYNAVRDEIVVNSRNMNEFWVIDHSTTTSQAASTLGGNSGKGGDFLYRWGNSAAYDRGSNSDQRLYGPHSPYWIPDTLPGGGNFLVFNNGTTRPFSVYSTVEEIVPPLNLAGQYTLNAGQPFGPTTPTWIWTAPNPQDMYSATVSGAQRLPNGNTLICEGARGNIFEVDTADQIVWKYVNPIGSTGPTLQGNNPIGTSIFRATFYPESFAAFIGRTLLPGDRLELDPFPLPTACLINSTLAPQQPQIIAYPNPFDEVLFWESTNHGQLTLMDIAGKSYGTFHYHPGKNSFSTTALPAGMYLLKFEDQSSRVIKMIKQ